MYDKKTFKKVNDQVTHLFEQPFQKTLIIHKKMFHILYLALFYVEHLHKY